MQTIFSLNPSYGLFVTDNFLLKGNLGAYGGFDSKVYVLNTGISGRYYFPIKKKLYVYPELSIEYEKSGFGNNISSPSSQFFTFGGGLGCSYFISNNIAIDATLLKLQTIKRQLDNFTGSVGAQNIRLLYFIR